MSSYYEGLPIYRTAADLVVMLDRVVRGFSRYHKYTLGTRLRDTAIEIVLQVARCNTKEQRSSELPRLCALAEELKLLVNLGKEVQAFQSFSQFQQIMDPSTGSGGGGPRPAGGGVAPCNASGHRLRAERAATPRRQCSSRRQCSQARTGPSWLAGGPDMIGRAYCHPVRLSRLASPGGHPNARAGSPGALLRDPGPQAAPAAAPKRGAETSSVYANNTDNAWIVNFDDGSTNNNDTGNTNNVRCVR